MRSTVPVTGMTCAACERRVSGGLSGLPGVERVTVNVRNGTAEVWSTQELDPRAVRAAVRAAGYDVGGRSRTWLSRDPIVWRDAALGLGVVSVLLAVAAATGLLDLSGRLAEGDSVSLGVILLIGLTAGFSTCMALVGGLVLGVSAQYARLHPEVRGRRAMAPLLAFTVGRVLGFLLLGGVVGALGSGLALDGPALGIGMILVAVVLALVGLQLAQVSPRLATGWLPTLPAGLSRRLGVGTGDRSGYSHSGAALLGALSFFLPCGFTQAVQLYALSTGSFAAGAAVMGVFALGTAPGLIGAGALTAWLRGPRAVHVFRMVGALVLVLAAVNLVGGLRVLGVSGSDSAAVPSEPTDNVTVVDGTQVVRVTQDADGYRPELTVLQAGLPTRWIITSEAPISCAAALRVPDLGIRTMLTSGENVFEFTADEPGVIDYNCAMGMFPAQLVSIAATSG